jgi:hypothetical protein
MIRFIENELNKIYGKDMTLNVKEKISHKRANFYKNALCKADQKQCVSACT